MPASRDIGADMAAGVAFTPGGLASARVVDAAFRARQFARQRLRPGAVELHHRLARDHDYFPWDLVRAGAELGWLSAAIPEIWGGGGLGIAEMAAAVEELCAGDAGVANIFGAHGLGFLPVLLSMDLELCERALAPVAAGEKRARPLLCAYAITEPGGGSDVEEVEGLATGDVRSMARKVAGGYRITGRKVFISNGNVCELVSFFAALDPKSPADSWTGFWVRSDAPGFSCARTERKMGQRACPAGELVLDDVFVPDSDRIGAEGSGWGLTRQTLAVSRGPVGAIATGIARDAFEAACAYVAECEASATAARRTAAWMHELLAAMAIRIRAARATYLEAAVHCDQALLPDRRAQRAVALLARAPVVGGKLVRSLSDLATSGKEEAWAHQCVLGATAKVMASDAAMWVTSRALDIIPADAGPLRARAEKAFCDAKLTQIYEGTNQINLRAIAHESWQRRLSPP